MRRASPRFFRRRSISGMTVIVLLVVIVVLLYTRRPDRDYTLGVMLLIAAFIGLAIKIRLLSVLGDLFALALEHWLEIVMAFGTAILLSVPAIMIYIAVRDHLDKRKMQESHGPVRSKFERRVTTLMALGHGRTQAEATAIRLLKRDFENHPSAKQASKNHA
jgi:dipeptide/tripeptide permease